MQTIMAVFVGGGLGSLARFGIGQIVSNDHFPWATLVANAISCVILGMAIGFLTSSQMLDNRWKLFLVTGFCGGFSTFSTFSYETFKLWSEGEHFACFANIGGSVIVCLFCIYIGIKITT